MSWLSEWLRKEQPLLRVKSLILDGVRGALIGPGDYLFSAYGGTRRGFLYADGTAVSRIKYAALFRKIGTTYGSGDGSTTFNLPDRRGRFGLCLDNMGGSTAGRVTSASTGGPATTLGGTGGAETHTLTEAQIPAHTHTDNGSDGSYNLQTGGTNIQVNANTNGTTGSTGGGLAHNNMPPYITEYVYIKF